MNTEEYYLIGGEKYSTEDLEKILTKQFHHLFKDRRLDVIEFEYEEDGELFFNVLADGRNFVTCLNMKSSYIFWDKNL